MLASPLSFGKPILAMLAQEQEEAICFGSLMKTVCHSGTLAGRERHGQPVRSTEKIASKMARSG